MEEKPSHEENKKSIVRKNFETELRKHGFGFQYAVIKEIERLYNANQSAWLPRFSEFPVEINNNNTHIDFILERIERDSFPRKSPFFLIGECKRANPAQSNWCFVRSSFAQEGLLTNFVYAEMVQLVYNSNLKRSSVKRLNAMAEKVFDIAFNVKSDDKGEGDTKGVNDAVSQVLRGMNGFIEYIGKKDSIIKSFYGETFSPYFLPVVFTTADLWTSSIDLSKANLISGNLDLPKESLTNVSWLLFQYNQSPPIRHSINIEESGNNIFEMAETEFTRTVAIVNPNGINNFLYWMSHFSKFV